MASKKKLAFSTLGCPAWSFEKTLDEAQKMGFSGVEIRGLEDKLPAKEIAQFFPENKAATLAAFKAHNLEIAGFGSSVYFHDLDKYDSMLAEGKRDIDVCGFMGITTIRIFGNNLVEGEAEASVISRIAKGAGALAEYGEGKGVMVLLETHGDYNTVERIGAIIDQAKSKNLRLLWDISHTDAVYEDNFMEFYKPMKHLIVHTHIRDQIRGEKGNESTNKTCFVGEGQIPVKAIVRQLLADGYGGYFSFEWEKKWQPELPEPELAFPGFVRFLNEI
ncbi:MAG: sugar phosphate isomerase/epimerase [Treponema sp.]|jgi:sugar phosphate isomerase/epimerase|nr:sugar phosphate isomerase/epimerase [Treponema sp.]